jgi:cytochrome c biogenesis protein CcmG/thiol:disulfide interchange protein DsbE
MTTDVRAVSRVRVRRWLLPAALPAVLLAAGLSVSACVGPRALATGDQASSFSVPALANSGDRISLSQYAGRPVIINFCASWAPACAAETQLLGHYFRYHHGRVLIVGIEARDERAAGLRMLRQSLVTYPVGADPALAVGARFHVPGIPATYFLDARHEIVETELGWLDWHKVRLGVKAMDAGKIVRHPNGG